MNDYRAFCAFFYAAHYLPIALYSDDSFVCSSGFTNDNDPYPFVRYKFSQAGNTAVYVSGDSGYYGLVRCDCNSIIIGPAYSTPVTEQTVAAYINRNAISPEDQGDIAQFLCGIPNYTYNQFLNLLLYLLYTLTGEQKSVSEAFDITDTQISDEIGRQHTERVYYAREEQQRRHGTYNFERQMLEHVKSGDVARLNQFLLSSLSAVPLTEGKLADTPLRQAKNLLIGTVSMVGKEAAIPAGMDIEQTYQLIDTYIQECERLQSEEEIKNLQYNMLMDFTGRVSQQRTPSGVSKEVFLSMQYISTHINEPLGAESVVANSGRSRSYLFSKFRSELGMSIADYIMQCRLREAKSLLRYTEKSLSEISTYLCFSSQSYFQNVFKKNFGVTPKEYRISAVKTAIR